MDQLEPATAISLAQIQAGKEDKKQYVLVPLIFLPPGPVLPNAANIATLFCPVQPPSHASPVP